jgi:hypothetical protein
VIGVLAFVFGWFAWSFAVVGGCTWVMVSVPGSENMPLLFVPLSLVGAGLVWGGFFAGLRILVGDWRN